MNETEQAQAFEQYMWDSCRKLFEEYGGDWQRLSATEQEVVVLWRAEADIYNGGILQFVCNWGQQHLQQAMTIMDKIGAHQSAALLRKAEQALAYLIDDVRIQELWDIPQYLSAEAEAVLDAADQAYWEDSDHMMLKAYRHYLADAV